jgi:hypothetical protein
MEQRAMVQIVRDVLMDMFVQILEQVNQFIAKQEQFPTDQGLNASNAIQVVTLTALAGTVMAQHAMVQIVRDVLMDMFVPLSVLLHPYSVEQALFRIVIEPFVFQDLKKFIKQKFFFNK